ncbi:MAG: hypothetical protein JXB42_13535 [Deltaproteobacteria bacterium]|nr:hypothetical protein [Deltaproteobacteria bacterium]
MPKKQIIYFLLSSLIAILTATPLGCSNTQNTQEQENVINFSNSPESQRFKGLCSNEAKTLIELDHYLLGIGEDPCLYVNYKNISNEPIRLDIGIEWTTSENLLIQTVRQHDVRNVIQPGQEEELVYKPAVVTTPSTISNYHILIYLPDKFRLPYPSLGPQVSPFKSSSPIVLIASIEKANLSRSELFELQKAINEVITQEARVASDLEKSLLSQASKLVMSTGSSNAVDILREKTPQQRMVLDGLATAFADALNYWGKTFHGIEISSLIGKSIAKGAEGLGNKIAEWLWMGEVGLLRIKEPNTGVMDVAYDMSVGEIWVNTEVYSPACSVNMYIPLEPTVVSSEGVGNIILTEGVRPAFERCKIIYRYTYSLN